MGGFQLLSPFQRSTLSGILDHPDFHILFFVLLVISFIFLYVLLNSFARGKESSQLAFHANYSLTTLQVILIQQPLLALCFAPFL